MQVLVFLDRWISGSSKLFVERSVTEITQHRAFVGPLLFCESGLQPMRDHGHPASVGEFGVHFLR